MPSNKWRRLAQTSPMSLMVKRRSQTELGMTDCANRKLTVNLVEGLEARISQWVRGAVHQIDRLEFIVFGRRKCRTYLEVE